MAVWNSSVVIGLFAPFGSRQLDVTVDLEREVYPADRDYSFRRQPVAGNGLCRMRLTASCPSNASMTA
jgi:hypothetical protein